MFFSSIRGNEQSWHAYAESLVTSSPFLRVRDSPGEGRGVFATHFIPKNTVVYRCKPIARFCLKPLVDGSSISLSSPSGTVHYCSEACKNASFATRDDILLRCKTASDTLNSIYEDEKRKFPAMVVDILATVLQDLRRDAAAANASSSNGAFSVADDDTIIRASSHVGHFCHMKFPAALRDSLEEEHDAILRIFSDARIATHEDLAAFFPLREYARTLGVLQLNAFRVTTEASVVAVALLPGIASFFNHSCEPTVRVSHDPMSGDVLFVADRDVARFSQLHISYVDVDEEYSAGCVARSETLYEKYGFKCKCVAAAKTERSADDVSAASHAPGVRRGEGISVSAETFAAASPRRHVVVGLPKSAALLEKAPQQTTPGRRKRRARSRGGVRRRKGK